MEGAIAVAKAAVDRDNGDNGGDHSQALVLYEQGGSGSPCACAVCVQYACSVCAVCVQCVCSACVPRVQ